MNANLTVPNHHPARQVVIDLAVMTAIGVLLALIGPFGSFANPFALRLVYWLGLSWAGYACYRPIGGLITRLGPRLDLPEWALWLLACLVATIPMTVVVWLVGSLPLPLEVPRLEVWMGTYGYVLAIGSVITGAFYLLEVKSGKPQPAARVRPAEWTPDPALLPQAQSAPLIPRLFNRISPRLGRDLIALEMEDHYVRVHTALGSELILLRMRDAMAELDGIPGAQVHRSWWVTRAAVSSIDRDGRNLRLVLHSGLIAPVARNMVPVLKADGWL